MSTTQACKIYRRAFPGPVIAAGTVGPRTVALYVEGDAVTVGVAGKRLGTWLGRAFRLTEFGLEPPAPERVAETPLAPLVFAAGDLLCRFGDDWYRMHPDGTVTHDVALRVATATELPDQPMLVSLHGDELVTNTHRIGSPARVVAGGHGCVAWSQDSLTWELRDARKVAHSVTLKQDTTVLGVVMRDGLPELVTRSRTGRTIRCVGPTQSRTLTKWATNDLVSPASVHPTRPWLAVVSQDGAVDVVDLTGPRTLARIEPSS